MRTVNKIQLITKLGLLLFLLQFESGCAGYLPGHSYRQGDYSWGFINRSDKDLLQNVEFCYVSAGEQGRARVGYLAPGKAASHDGGVYPVPENGILRWGTADGQAHEQQVAIRSTLPVASNTPDPTYFKKGTVWFVYDGKDWTVKPLTWQEEERRIVQEKKSYPQEVVY